MAVGHTGLEPGGIARAQQRLALVIDQYDLALDDEYEFVLVLMPMTLRRGGARLEPGEVDPELSQPRRVAERVFLTADDRRLEPLRIGAAQARGDLADVDLGHVLIPVARMNAREAGGNPGSRITLRSMRATSDSLNNRRGAHPGADAQRDERGGEVAPLELIEHSSEDHGAGRAERMPHGDGATVHIHFRVVEIERLHVTQHH